MPGMRPQPITAVGCPGKASRPAPFTTPRSIRPEGRPMTKLERLYTEYGQSLWLDDLIRGYLEAYS